MQKMVLKWLVNTPGNCILDCRFRWWKTSIWGPFSLWGWQLLLNFGHWSFHLVPRGAKSDIVKLKGILVYFFILFFFIQHMQITNSVTTEHWPNFWHVHLSAPVILLLPMSEGRWQTASLCVWGKMTGRGGWLESGSFWQTSSHIELFSLWATISPEKHQETYCS